MATLTQHPNLDAAFLAQVYSAGKGHESVLPKPIVFPLGNVIASKPGLVLIQEAYAERRKLLFFDYRRFTFLTMTCRMEWFGKKDMGAIIFDGEPDIGSPE